jgi:hypothetical protein
MLKERGSERRWSLRRHEQATVAGCPDLHVGGGGQAEGEPTLVDPSVMERTEQDQVVERNAAAV